MGERAPKKRDFPESALIRLFWPVFFSKTCLRRIKFGQNGAFIVIWESSENQFGRPKKIDKIFENFSKIRPPLSGKS